MLFIIFAVAVSIIKISTSENRLTSCHAERQIIENTAKATAKIALADLQFFAGADSIATAKCPIKTAGTEEWFAAWGSKNPPHFSENSPQPLFIPLVSRGGNLTGTQIFHARNSRNPQDKIALPTENLPGNLRVSYQIIDESQKASLSQFEKEAYLKKYTKDKLQNLRQLSNPEIGFRTIFEKTDTNSKEFRESLRKAKYDKEFFLSKFHLKNNTAVSLTEKSLCVLADWQRESLKNDISDETFSDEILTEEFLRGGNANFSKPAGTEMLTTTAPAKSHGKMKFKEEVFPFIVELRLHVGFFNARTDGQHRARFHVTAKLWNPYPFPLIAHGDGNFGLLDFDNLPLAEIFNANTGEAFTFGLSDFPKGRFGLVSQTASDKTFNAYCKIFDTSDQGFGGGTKSPFTGLHPGEIFLAVYPNPEGQPSGLSRITGGATWKFQKKSPTKAPYGTNGNRWFHASHVINITIAPSIFPSQFLFRFHRGNIQRHTLPENYSEAFLGFKNLQLPGTQLKISGEKYNRQSAGEYSINQANIVYKIRLKTEDEIAMKNLFEKIDLRSGVLDFAKKEVSDAFEISLHTGTDAEKFSSAETDQTDTYFFDKYKNYHKKEEPSAFACIPMFDKPTEENLSTGTLRYFQIQNSYNQKIGLKNESKQNPLNSILDRYFFSGIREKEEAIGENPHLEKISTITNNPDPAGKKHPLTAEKFLLRGAFNINSTDANAWLAVLSTDLTKWSQKFIGKDTRKNPSLDLKNVFFTLPFSAHFLFHGGASRAFSDKELEKYDHRSRERILLSQGIRSLEDEKMEKLSREIAKLVSERIYSEKKPFKSIEEFANSGLLDKAIERAEINKIGKEKIPRWFPSFLDQSDIIQALVIIATPRGDTFTIKAKAEKFNPLTQKIDSVAVVEMRVQRTPEFFDNTQAAGTPPEKQNALNRVLGRRFKITSMRLLNHDEM